MTRSAPPSSFSSSSSTSTASTAALVADNLDFVRALAGTLARTGAARYVERDELISLGTLALLETARRYDPAIGARFSTFAFPRVRGAMIDGIADGAPIKRSAFRGRRATGKPTRYATSSLETMTAHGHELAAEAFDPGEALDRARTRRRVAAAVAALPARKRRFVEGHYDDERGLKDIGAELGLSKSWSSRLHAQALTELRAALA